MTTNQLDNFSSTSVNWRNTLRQNARRTYIVIALFFLIYAGIGMLVDMYLQAAIYPQASLSQLFHLLITFKLLPVATLIMFGIAAVSLLVSYSLYDKLMLLGTHYHQVTADSKTPSEKQLYNVVEEMQIAAGIRYMPKVFIIDADYMNAFASGYSEKSAMIAITRGLMEKLNRDELQAVMAHELSHIRHMDIKLTLTASLLSNLTIIVLDIFFYNAIYLRRRNSNSRSQNSLALVIILLRYILPVINILMLLYLSRKRELMADAGCVELMRSNQPLATALMKISRDHEEHRDKYTALYQNTKHENVRREAYIFDPLEAGIRDFTSFNDVFSTHPSLEERLRSLGFERRQSL